MYLQSACSKYLLELAKQLKYRRAFHHTSLRSRSRTKITRMLSNPELEALKVRIVNRAKEKVAVAEG